MTQPQYLSTLSLEALAIIFKDLHPWASGKTLGYSVDGQARRILIVCGLPDTALSLDTLYKAVAVRIAELTIIKLDV
jgi:hypothetical protein